MYNSDKGVDPEWSSVELAIRLVRNQKDLIFSKYTLNFSTALLLRLRKSVLGPYIDVLNCQQVQDKLLNENKMVMTSYDLAKLRGKEQKVFEKNNAVLDDALGALKALVSTRDVVSLEALQLTTVCLRLHDFYMNVVDGELRSFTSLQVLVLTGNNLRGIEGSLLPRGLRFLELYNNFIGDITKLVDRVPKFLTHLGLGRNKLDDNSSLHLLARGRSFAHLRSLDLSDNDISDLPKILNVTKKLSSLQSLQLEGNPCYVETNYKNATVKHTPSLLFLDNVEISKMDRCVSEETFEERKNTPQLVFHCYRIMGIRSPPKDKKNQQTLHLELQLPLLAKNSTPSPKTKTKADVPAKAPEAEKPPTTKKQKTTPKTSPYDNPNEYDPQSEKSNVSFKTDKSKWNRVIQFPPILIDPPNGDTTLIRDTLRTRVKIDVVYLKASKVKGKKGKSPGKKNKGKTDPKSDGIVQGFEETPQEAILKRVTLFSFYCSLENVNWSDDSIDFIWMDHPKFGGEGLKMHCLKDLIYGKLPKSDSKSKLKRNEENMHVRNVQQKIPKVFTCHVGFGLKRD